MLLNEFPLPFLMPFVWCVSPGPSGFKNNLNKGKGREKEGVGGADRYGTDNRKRQPLIIPNLLAGTVLGDSSLIII